MREVGKNKRKCHEDGKKGIEVFERKNVEEKSKEELPKCYGAPEGCDAEG
jgi:hypothetical protein